uniref:ATP-grasp domain-containing protein n=1 Tax=Alexandrium catenella TaxID=2925 RepID=A0A7S1KW93_ALECA
MTAEELYAAEFAREMQREADPRITQHSDKLRGCREEGDWRGACGILEDMWRGKVDPEPWMYSVAIEACCEANETESAEALQEELQSWGAFPGVARFQLSPVCSWQRQLKRAGCGVHNTLAWNGQDPLPSPEGPCWLLPAQDEAAEDVARNQAELRHAGWKLLTCAPEVIAQLRSKDRFYELAEGLGLASLLPERYATPWAASYPCVIKPARGTWGKNVHVVYGSEEVLRLVKPGKAFEVERQVEQQLEYRDQYLEQAGQESDPEEAWVERNEEVERALREWIDEAEHEELGENWVLQELAPGHLEYSTSLLVHEGKILDAMCSRYEFGSDVYVWPALEYSRSEYVSVPKEHLDIMSRMLVGFSGVCNFNYKLRPSGKICIFEVNPRVGGDLVFDVPKKRVRAFFEKLDAMFS